MLMGDNKTWKKSMILIRSVWLLLLPFLSVLSNRSEFFFFNQDLFLEIILEVVIWGYWIWHLLAFWFGKSLVAQYASYST